MDKGFKCSCFPFSRKVVPVLLGLPGGVATAALGCGGVSTWGSLTGTPVPALHPGRANNQGNKSSGASLWLFSYPEERDRRDPEAIVKDLNTGHGIRNSTAQAQGESSLKGCKISFMASLKVCSQNHKRKPPAAMKLSQICRRMHSGQPSSLLWTPTEPSAESAASATSPVA